MLKQLGLIGGGVISEALARAQTNEVAVHRVAMPLGADGVPPAVISRRTADGATTVLFLPAGAALDAYRALLEPEQ